MTRKAISITVRSTATGAKAFRARVRAPNNATECRYPCFSAKYSPWRSRKTWTYGVHWGTTGVQARWAVPKRSQPQPNGSERTMGMYDPFTRIRGRLKDTQAIIPNGTSGYTKRRKVSFRVGLDGACPRITIGEGFPLAHFHPAQMGTK